LAGLDPQQEKWAAARRSGAPEATGTLAEPGRERCWTRRVQEQWRKLVDKYAAEDKQRTELNQKEFVSFADFRTGDAPAGKLAAVSAPSKPVATSCCMLMGHSSGNLPAGTHRHDLREAQRHARSPVIPPGKRISAFK
jgi:hypothetical protein